MGKLDKLTFLAQLSLDFIFSGDMEFPRKGEEVSSDEFDIQLGGGTLSYPIVLNKLGIPCKIIAKKSDSFQFQMAKKLLEGTYNGEVEFVEANYDPVMCTCVFSHSDDRSFITHNDKRSLEFEDEWVFDKLKHNKVAFVFEENYRIIPRLKQLGVTIVFDTGWEEELSIEKLKDILSYVDYFTPNEVEAIKMTGASNVSEALSLLDKYVKTPIITLGERGAVAIIEGKEVYFEPPRDVLAVDATGAGDNFMSGLIYGIYTDMTVEDAIKFAVKTGSLSTMSLGVYGTSYRLDDIMKKD